MDELAQSYADDLRYVTDAAQEAESEQPKASWKEEPSVPAVKMIDHRPRRGPSCAVTAACRAGALQT